MADQNAKGINFEILIVDDEKALLKTMKFALRRKGITNIVCCSDSREVMSLLKEKEFALIFLDIVMPHISGDELFFQITSKYPHIPIIVLTGHDEIAATFKRLKSESFDYLVKPVSVERFIKAIHQAIMLPPPLKGIITKSRSMRSIFKKIRTASESLDHTLITGDTGVGKELVAYAIHNLSTQAKNLIPVNVGGLSEGMFDDTLFGHVKGAFSDAIMERLGLIKQAENGSLFLDEIGELSEASQVKLLRFLDKGEYYPLGSDKLMKANTRIIAATNKNLEVLKEEGIFRKDIYFRLKQCEINVPPLRERKEDIPLLIDHFIDEICKEQKRSKPEVPEESYEILKAYNFPGNIRELKNLIRDVLKDHDLPVLPPEVFGEKIPISANYDKSNDSIKIAKSEEIAHKKNILPCGNTLGWIYLKEVLAIVGEDNVKAAADLMGVETRQLTRLLESFEKKLTKKGTKFGKLPDLAGVVKTLDILRSN